MGTTFINEWEWDASHTPLPLTPSFGSVYPGWMETAMRVTFREFGMLPAGIDMCLRDGYAFTRVRAAGLPVIPPAWLVQPALQVWWLHPTVARRVRTAVRRLRDGHDRALLTRWESVWRRTIVADQQRLRAIRLAGLSDAALAGHIERLIARTGRWVIVHFLLHGAISIRLYALDQFLVEHRAPAGVRTNYLVRGSSAASSAPARALRAVAAPLRGRADLLGRAAAMPASDALALLRSQSAPFAGALDRYLTWYGHGIAGRYEFIVPALAERPETLIPAILRAARESETDSTEPDAERLIEQAAAVLPDAGAAQTFRRLVAEARRAYAIRDENVQITFLDAFGLCRTALREAGDRLAARGAIVAAEDVFFLTVPEIIGALRGERTVGFGAPATRRVRWHAAIRRPPPRGLGRRIPLVDFRGLPAEARTANRAVIRYMREIMATPDVYPDRPAAGALVQGVGAVAGTYTGIARVLRDQEDFDRLAPGEVLVCSITSPAWAPVLPLAGALVTDHGGVLSHPAVIAREFGIPAVVATRRATRLIPDGARVEVDGTRGTVRIVE